MHTALGLKPDEAAHDGDVVVSPDFIPDGQQLRSAEFLIFNLYIHLLIVKMFMVIKLSSHFIYITPKGNASILTLMMEVTVYSVELLGRYLGR